jgi:heme/copper-type cytochrome/quinol oxidase subunit 2
MSQAWLNALQAEIQRQVLIAMLLSVVCFVVTMWVLYMVIKAAIRDGIQESGLIESRRALVEQRGESGGWPDTVLHIPEMRADR